MAWVFSARVASTAAIEHPRPELLLGFPLLISAGLVVSAHDAGETAIRVEIAPTAHRLMPRVLELEVLPTGFPWRKAALLAHIILAHKRIVTSKTVNKEAIGSTRFQGDLEGPVLFAVVRSGSQNGMPMDFTAENICYGPKGRKVGALWLALNVVRLVLGS